MVTCVFFQVVEGFLPLLEQFGEDKYRFFDPVFPGQALVGAAIDLAQVLGQALFEVIGAAWPALLAEGQVLAPLRRAEVLFSLRFLASQRNGMAQGFGKITVLEHLQHALHVGGLAFAVEPGQF